MGNILTVTSVRIANFTRVRITMASPMQSVLVPCSDVINFTQCDGWWYDIGLVAVVMLNKLCFACARKLRKKPLSIMVHFE